MLLDSSRRACDTCGTPYPAPPLRALPQPGRAYWVAVRAEFTCKACGFDVPLNHFELGDGVICTRCGVEQRYDASDWQELVAFAHRVGDFGGPGPEGRFPDPARPLSRQNPFVDLGAGASWARLGLFRTSPGNPLCRTCKAPLVIADRRGPHIEVACSRCGDRHRYEVPPHVRIPHLAGVLADEHEEGRRDANIVQESGVVILRCPNCSAPLSGVKDEDGVVACGYCKVPCRVSTHTHARAGHKQTPTKTWWLCFDGPCEARASLHRDAERDAERVRERTARTEHQREVRAGIERKAKRAERKALIPFLSVMLAAPVIAGVIYIPQMRKKQARETAAANLPGDETLLRFSFTMSQADVTALLGEGAKPGATVKLRKPGVFEEVRLGGAGGPTYSIDLHGGAKFDAKAIVSRLATIAPNALREGPNGLEEISIDKTLVRIDPRKMPAYTGRVEVMTWVKDEKEAAAAGDAFLAAVKWAALGGPELTPAQRRLFEGAPLSDAARLDVTVPVEDASRTFTALLPLGTCQTRTDLVTRKTELLCTAEVGDRIVAKVSYAWPSTAGARLHTVTLSRRAVAKGQTSETDPTPCLTSALGPGKKKVVDFASGRSETSWAVGSHGDRIVLDEYAITFQVRDSADPKAPADWTKEHAKVIDAIAGCGR